VQIWHVNYCLRLARRCKDGRKKYILIKSEPWRQQQSKRGEKSSPSINLLCWRMCVCVWGISWNKYINKWRRMAFMKKTFSNLFNTWKAPKRRTVRSPAGWLWASSSFVVVVVGKERRIIDEPQKKFRFIQHEFVEFLRRARRAQKSDRNERTTRGQEHSKPFPISFSWIAAINWNWLESLYASQFNCTTSTTQD